MKQSVIPLLRQTPLVAQNFVLGVGVGGGLGVFILAFLHSTKEFFKYIAESKGR